MQSIAIDYIFEVIVIGQLEHNVVGNSKWFFCNRLPISSSWPGDFGICWEGFQSSLKNVACRKVPTAAKSFENLVFLNVNEDLVSLV